MEYIEDSIVHAMRGDEDDKLPGQPWPGPSAPPQPDGGSPEGDGKHRK